MSNEEKDYSQLDKLVNEERIKAIVRLLLPLVVQVFGYFGIVVDPESLWGFACAIIGVVSMVIAWWWKNNNWTKAAVKAQQDLNEYKEEEKNAA